MQMDENGWIPVIATEELPQEAGVQGGSVRDVRDARIAAATTIFAVASRCTHQGAPLDRGVVKATGSEPRR